MNGGFTISDLINSSLILIYIHFLSVPNELIFIYPKPIPFFKTGEKVPDVVTPI